MRVVKIAKPGFDALEADDKDLAFSSELPSHSIYEVVTVTKTSPATSVTYNHALGFVPKVWIFVSLNDGSGDYYRRIPQLITGDRMDYYITDQDIVIQTSVTTTLSFRVVIFTRSANP